MIFQDEAERDVLLHLGEDFVAEGRQTAVSSIRSILIFVRTMFILFASITLTFIHFRTLTGRWKAWKRGMEDLKDEAADNS